MEKGEVKGERKERDEGGRKGRLLNDGRLDKSVPDRCVPEQQVSDVSSLG